MIIEKNKCCGCGACQNICPKQCIEMKMDAEGFFYPVIDAYKCVHCDLCKKICPVEKKMDRSFPPLFFAGYNRKVDVLLDSSSGGIFWPIVETFIYDGAIVYGAVQKDKMHICHERYDDLENCKLFRKSKYLQSDVGYSYKQVKKDLDCGKTVLFSGTPCQVAALYSFLQKDYDNLFTIDVVCHGTPSRAVFDRYIEEQEKKYKKKIVSFCWRDKSQGWGPNRITMTFEDGSKYTSTSQENPMQKGFLDNWYLRPSCYECKFAKLPRIADISLADFWGYDMELTKQNNNGGISLIAVSSERGQLMFDKIKNELFFHPVTKEYACERARHLWTHPSDNPKRQKFMNDFLSGKSFESLNKKYIQPSVMDRIKRKIERVIKSCEDDCICIKNKRCN